MQEKLYAAIDLGGTKIYTILADKNRQILTHTRLDTPAHEGPEKVMEQIALSVKTVLKQANANMAQLAAAGICLAGFFDWQKRILVSSPNIPDWHNIPVEERLTAILGIPVVAENDANAAALGEVRKGAGRGSQHAAFVTVSTGIGAGLILNGQIYRGGRGFAGEVGHMVVKSDGPLCGCGRRGCLETLASGTAIARTANEALQSGRDSILRDIAAKKGGEVTAPDVFTAARQGDETAQGILIAAIHYLGIGLVNLVNLLNPEVVIIGGGVSEAGNDLLVPLQNFIRDNAVPPAAASVVLQKAVLGVEAGVIGMLCLLAEDHRNL